MVNGYGFVNAPYNGEDAISNEEYLATIPEDHPWKAIIVEADKRLSQRIPEYKIVQIKSKFNELRYYVELPEGLDDELVRFAHATIRQAEEEAWYKDELRRKSGG